MIRSARLGAVLLVATLHACDDGGGGSIGSDSSTGPEDASSQDGGEDGSVDGGKVDATVSPSEAGSDACTGAGCGVDAGCAGGCSGHGECTNQTCTCATGYSGPACADCTAGWQRGSDGTCAKAAQCTTTDECTLGAAECRNGSQRVCKAGPDGCLKWTQFTTCANQRCVCATNDPKTSVSLWGASGRDEARGLALTSRGDLLVTGTIGLMAGSTDSAAFLNQMSFAGGTLTQSWSEQWGTTGQSVGASLYVDAAQNVFALSQVVGTVYGQTAKAQATLLTRWNADHTRGFTTLLDSAQWDVPYALAADAAGGFYVVGETSGVLEIGGSSKGNFDAFLGRVAANGMVQWVKQWGTSEDDAALGVQVDAQGAVLVAGIQTGLAFVRKVDANGIEMWRKVLGASTASAWSLLLRSDGGMWVTGHSQDAIVPGETTKGAYLLRLNASGDLVWSDHFGKASTDIARAIAPASNGDFFVAGTTDGALAPNAVPEGAQVFLQRRRADGSVVWTKQVPGKGTAQVYGMAVAADDTVYVSGSTAAMLGELAMLGDQDAFVVRFGP